MVKDGECEDSFSLESRLHLVLGPQILQAAANGKGGGGNVEVTPQQA